MATWMRKCSGMTQEEVDALSMKIAMKQEQHLIPLKEDLADWLNKTLVKGYCPRFVFGMEENKRQPPTVNPTLGSACCGSCYTRKVNCLDKPQRPAFPFPTTIDSHPLKDLIHFIEK
ncbi:unnamed protein product [Larinioides sclopetarius]|uniref:Uncharacterized protein n=1 Tax=Larinioides sclopetarius TaxID=280406 RepID=A0AAV2BQ82_9ARAC